MPFTTLSFVCFFAALFFAYYAVPRRWQWCLLLVGSAVFYGWMCPWYLLLLGATILVTWVGGICMAKVFDGRDAQLATQKASITRDEKRRIKNDSLRMARRILVATVIVLLVVLGVFKYSQFVMDNLFAGMNFLSGANRVSPVLDILLPVGLSFYVFQSMGYCIDVAREDIPAERNLFKHALFLGYFPQLLQGPIGRYDRLAPQLFSGHDFNYEEAVLGLQRVAWGFFKKFMIANMIAARIDGVWAHPAGHEGVLCWGAICTLYAVQIYADFSGYMDIACGCSRMLGIRLDENFDCPYLSKSIPEFWRRWHMTLSSWFKDYLFYPILRSEWNMGLRKRFPASRYLSNVIPTSLALAVVWAATGLWHGASWGYVAWGVYYGLFMIANVAMQPVYDKFAHRFPKWTACRVHGVLQVVRTFAVVVVGYSIFKPGDLSLTWEIWKLAWAGDWIGGLRTLPHNGQCSWVFIGLVTGVLLAVDLWHAWRGPQTIRVWLRSRPAWLRWLVYLGGTWVVVYMGLYGSGFDQFEYFKF